jgi:hypothetical protein
MTPTRNRRYILLLSYPPLLHHPFLKEITKFSNMGKFLFTQYMIDHDGE